MIIDTTHDVEVFIVDTAELRWMHARGFDVPKHCKPCRVARRAERKGIDW